VLLIEQALGMRKHKLYEHYDFAGYPSLGLQARFSLPTRFGDEVEIASTITKVGRSSFSLQHLLTLDGVLAVEGNETRCWVVRDPSRPGGLRAQPMPDDVVAKFSATAA
jgi:4-hydroxybenzoyl-CoA thioesterase